MQALSQAGELSLRLPQDARPEKLRRSVKSVMPSIVEGERIPSRALAVVARNDANSAVFIEKFKRKYCRGGDVSEEWKPVDDSTIDKLRGILAALKEESQATQLLKKESEDRQAGQELEVTRNNVRARLEACKGQSAIFEEKQAELKRHVMENEKSLRLMETNIEKGEKKAKEETAECRRLDAEIKAVEKDIQDHEEERMIEERLIAKAAPHKAFLDSVVQECEQDFEGDIKVLMNRYNTLDSELQTLHTRNADLASQLNRVREELQKVQADIQTEQMMSSSRLHEVQVSLEKHRSESNNLETELNRMLEEKELNKSKVGIILMAIEQIFTRTVQSCRLKQRREAMLAEVDIKFAPVRGDKSDARLEAMLNQIIARVKDLKEMSDEVRKALEKKKKVEMVMMDDGDILDRVQFVQQRPRNQGEAHVGTHEAPSSHQSSDLALGANTSSLRASQANSLATSGGSGEAADFRGGGGDGVGAGPSGGKGGASAPPGEGGGASGAARRKPPPGTHGLRSARGGAQGDLGPDAGIMAEVGAKDVVAAFRAA